MKNDVKEDRCYKCGKTTSESKNNALTKKNRTDFWYCEDHKPLKFKIQENIIAIIISSIISYYLLFYLIINPFFN